MFTWNCKKVICMMSAAVLLTGVSFAANPVDVYKEAAQNMAAQPEGEYVVTLNVKLPVTSTSLVDTIDLQDKPFKLKSVTELTVLNQTNSEFSTIYAEQEADHVNVFIGKKDNGTTTWKTTVRKLHSNAPVADAFTTNHAVMAGVKSVTSAGGNRYKVVFDASRIYQESDKAGWLKAGVSEQNADIAAAALSALQKTGDIPVLVTIDPGTKRITHAEGALTEQVRDAVDAVIDRVSGPEQTKKMVKQLVDNGAISVSVDYSPLPAGIDLSVPQAARAEMKKSA